MLNSNQNQNQKIIEPELSFKINGLLYEVQNQLGTKFQEKHYSKAIEALLIKNKIPYEKEKGFNLFFENKLLGNFRADFVIDGKILLELKTVDYLTSEHKTQTIRYLNALDLPLALLINFRFRPLKIWRITKGRSH